MFLFEALCFFIVLIFLVVALVNELQADRAGGGNVFGLFTFSHHGNARLFFYDYMDGLFISIIGKTYAGAVELGSTPVPRSYIITVGVYYVIRYFQGLKNRSRKRAT